MTHDTATEAVPRTATFAGGFNTAADAAVRKKAGLFDDDHPRYAVRAVLAGAYLTLGTAFAAVCGNAVDHLAPGLGPVVFGLLFFIGLAMILQLGAELATGMMMFAAFGAARGHLSWGRAVWMVIVTTVFNLVGAVAVAVVLGQSAKLGGLGADHLIASLADGKLTKDPSGIFLEAVVANFVVNIAIVGGLLIKDYAGKFLFTHLVIAVFVVLGLEHLIANFALFTLAFFCLGDGFAAGAGVLESLTLTNVLTNWGLALVGNVIGGGLLIGGVYAWLNRGTTPGGELYRD
ncbi:formate/nitrite transporter family protein [Corynebacterium sp. USCH3]|uniref:formate/nitrite transporter family protein n=1 Tax=Corynebacterium sp. USCH3 TaxID=3024840 RepID=UPI0030B5793D